MLTQQAIAFSRLGKLWQEVAPTFADTVDADALRLVQQGLQQGLGRRITKLVGVTKDEDGTFKGEFQQYVSPRLTKRFSFVYGEDELTFKSLNGDDIEKFSEEIEDFARQSKSGRAGKSLNCKVEQCGGRCLRSGEFCRLTPTTEQKKLWSQASGKNLATKPETSLAKKRREAKEGRAKEVAREVKPKDKKADIKKPTIAEIRAKELDSLKNEKHNSLENLSNRVQRLSGDKRAAFGEAVDKHLSLPSSTKPKDKDWLEGVETQANTLWEKAGSNPAIPETARERFARFVGDRHSREVVSAKKGEVSDEAIKQTFGQENPVSRASLQASKNPEKMGATGKLVEEWAKNLGQTAWLKATPAQKAVILEELGVDGVKDLGIKFKALKAA